MKTWITSLSLAYLLGSVPFGYLLVRFVRKQDIRTTGSGNIGATNVLRSGAKGLGIATLVLDCLKGVAAVLLAFALAHRALWTTTAAYDLACAAACAATLGHVFPVWLGFRGGKGVATAMGVFLVLSPPSVACAIAVFLVVVLISRFVSLGSLAAAALLPLGAWLFLPARTPLVLLAFFGIPLLVIGKHHGNIQRLLAGTESRFGAKRTPPAPVADTRAVTA